MIYHHIQFLRTNFRGALFISSRTQAKNRLHTASILLLSALYTGLVKIMLTLMDYFSPADRRTPWVTD
jgi:hypothetical protein